MGIDPPFLWPDHSPLGAPVRIRYDAGGSLAVLAVRGEWNAGLSAQVAAALRRFFAEQTTGLIIDLSRLDDPRANSAPTWMGARALAARQQPPVQLALCASPEQILADRLQHLGAGRFLPVYATVDQAHVAITGRLPHTDRMQLELRPDTEAPALARRLVEDACRSWRLTALRQPARLVVSELVNNAVEHAGTPITVTVSRRVSVLHVAVQDRCPDMPQLHPRTPGPRLPEHGMGLRLVHATALAWGAVSTDDGKIVWCAVRGPQTARRRRPRTATTLR
ncbi:ATP-binding protein [Krasilnikovia sp. MM14-A1259]|uniref:ATP-binding protein n=1 Tax=Krasilnikovia sp. MM14-A1259 TaxID=3373539 RepID=UPI00382C3EE8